MAMDPQAPYSWFPAYEAAAFETDFSLLYQRMDLALRAIEKRLDAPENLDNAEFTEIQDALRALQMLGTDEQS
jgi:hypothetical protein